MISLSLEYTRIICSARSSYRSCAVLFVTTRTGSECHVRICSCAPSYLALCCRHTHSVGTSISEIDRVAVLAHCTRFPPHKPKPCIFLSHSDLAHPSLCYFPSRHKPCFTIQPGRELQANWRPCTPFPMPQPSFPSARVPYPSLTSSRQRNRCSLRVSPRPYSVKLSRSLCTCRYFPLLPACHSPR